MFWDWLARERGEVVGERSRPDLTRFFTFISSLPEAERDAAFVRLLRLTYVLAVRELGGVEFHRLKMSKGTYLALMDQCLLLLHNWTEEGSLTTRTEHPEWFLTSWEMQTMGSMSLGAFSDLVGAV